MLLKDKVKLVISKHARDRMRERGIGFEDLIDALSNPVQLVYDRVNDVYIAVGVKGYAIVYAFRGSIVEVVTVLGRREYEALISKHGIDRYKVVG